MSTSSASGEKNNSPPITAIEAPVPAVDSIFAFASERVYRSLSGVCASNCAEVFTIDPPARCLS
jgi:hypothetical protein